jgi:hypothetical protein
MIDTLFTLLTASIVAAAAAWTVDHYHQQLRRRHEARSE